MKQLAIKGHATRGNEVIKILEMFGGNNLHDYSADCDSLCFYIEKGTNIIYYDRVNSCCEDEDTLIFTLEELLEKFPYKVGDKVLYKIYGIHSKIKSMLWNKEKEQVFYRLESNKLFVATADELKPIYPYKEETMEGKIESFEILESHCADEVKIEFDPFNFEIVEKDNVYYVVKKKQQYPKTYEEGCKITNSKIDRHYFYTKKDKEDYPEDVKIISLFVNVASSTIIRALAFSNLSTLFGIVNNGTMSFLSSITS
jgi:NACalpha-BTF3-like transcription factor